MTMKTALSHGRVVRARHSTEGGMALLVLVDSSGPYHNRNIVDETILVALEHFGMPYRLLDLAQQRPSAELLAGCAGLVIAQDGLGDSLTEGESQLIADAVGEGMGLVMEEAWKLVALGRVAFQTQWQLLRFCQPPQVHR